MSDIHIMNSVAAIAEKISVLICFTPVLICQANQVTYPKKTPTIIVKVTNIAKDRKNCNLCLVLCFIFSTLRLQTQWLP